ncbi:MAG: hypothetical protein IPM29_07010 [Planctomycetes bacterium]|nr:hypothetical protein [Planctomycetota bacterium]
MPNRPNVHPDDLTEVDPFGGSSIRYRISTWGDDIEDEWVTVAVVSFAGTYRPGSAGTPDAALMVAVLGASLAHCHPDAVIIDLSDLTYSWGDGLLQLFYCLDRWDRPHPPGCAVVGGRASLPALRSLLTPVGGESPPGLTGDLHRALGIAVRLGLERSRSLR